VIYSPCPDLRNVRPAAVSTTIPSLPTACAGCATRMQSAAAACPACSAPVGRVLRAWDTFGSWVTAVEWSDGPRVVKLAKDLHDERRAALARQEARLLAALAGRVPPGVIPELLVSGEGVLVTRYMPGVVVQQLLRHGRPELVETLVAAGRAVSALQSVDPACLPLRPEPGGLIPDLADVESLFPDWMLEAALAAGEERPPRPVLVHGDCVPSNWLWDGRQVCLLDFGTPRLGSAECDTALAWARLRLLGGGLRPVLGRRLAALVLRPPWPPVGVRWQANALVIVAWYDWLRFGAARREVARARRAILRVAIRATVAELEEQAGSAHWTAFHHRDGQVG
jgi:hypothetical protein